MQIRGRTNRWIVVATALLVAASVGTVRAEWSDAHGALVTDGSADSNTRWQKTPMVAPPLRLRWSYVSWNGVPTAAPTSTPFVPATCVGSTCTFTPTPLPVLPPQPWPVLENQYVVIAHGNLYVSDRRSRRVVAWDVATGQPIQSFWNKQGLGPNVGSVYASPAVANGIVYTGMDPPYQPLPNFYAFNAFTADVVPGFPVDTGSWVSAPPIVRSGVVFVGTLQAGGNVGRLIAYNAADATLLWSFIADKGQVRGAPAIGGNRVYFGTDAERLFCLDTSFGSMVWSQNIGGEAWGAPEIEGGWVYVGTNSNSIRCYNAANGQLRLGYPITTPNNWSEFEGGLSIVNGLIFAGSYNFGMYSWNAAQPLNPRPGFPAWSQVPIHSAPAYCNGYIYYGDDDDILRAVNADNGFMRWSFQIPTNRLATGTIQLKVFDRCSVAISDGVVAAASTEGNGVFVFEPVPDEPTPEPTRVILHSYENLIVPGQYKVLYTWDLPGSFHVKLSIYNTAGERIVTLFEGECPGPSCYALWDGAGPGHTRIASGVYVAALSVRGRGVYRVRTALLNQAP